MCSFNLQCTGNEYLTSVIATCIITIHYYARSSDFSKQNIKSINMLDLLSDSYIIYMEPYIKV